MKWLEALALGLLGVGAAAAVTAAAGLRNSAEATARAEPAAPDGLHARLGALEAANRELAVELGRVRQELTGLARGRAIPVSAVSPGAGRQGR